LSRNLSLLHESWRGASIDIFFFSASSDLERVVGRRTNGFVQPGEDTVLLVYDGRRPPVLQHELMHVVVNHAWGVAPSARDWLSEGIATWSIGLCQGGTFLQLAAGLDRRGELPSLRALAEDFRTLDELTAFIESASVVEFTVSRFGLGALREAWSTTKGYENPLGPNGDRIESEWRKALRNEKPHLLDVARMQAEGCEPPVP
jgi:hypothetical protein